MYMYVCIFDVLEGDAARGQLGAVDCTRVISRRPGLTKLGKTGARCIARSEGEFKNPRTCTWRAWHNANIIARTIAKTVHPF